MNNRYLDIQRIKAEITMEHILSHYGIRIQLRDVGTDRISGCCPIHHGDNSNAFHVDLKRNLFHCFTLCGGGSIFDFVMKMEQMEFYSAARKIWETFFRLQLPLLLRLSRIVLGGLTSTLSFLL